MRFKGDIYLAGVMILIGCVLLALVFGVFDSEDRADATIEFEDWIDYDTARIVGFGGPIEIEEGRIHAVGIGNAEIVNEDGSRYTIRILPADTVLVLMDGQSNAAYYQPVDPAGAIPPQLGQAFYFGYADRMPSGATEDISECKFYDFMDPASGELRVGDKGPAFARYYGELTGKKVIWVSLGIPGRMISTWGPTGNAWLQNVKVMDAAVPLIPSGFRIAETFVIWSQGESDYVRDTGYAHYLTAWKDLHDRAATAWHVDIGAWFLAEGRDDTCGWVNDAFKELSETVDGVHVIAEGIASSFSADNGLMHTDNLHYSQQGDNSIAAACAYGIARLQGQEIAGRSPIFLQESIIGCDIGETVDIGPVVCRNVDGNITRLEATWNGAPDTSTAGIVTVDGTTSMPDMLLPGCPDPVARILVGYVGVVDDLEYIENADGGLTVIGHEWTLADATIPETVDGTSVTAVADYAVMWGPWTHISIPDTVTSVGYRAFQSIDRAQSAYIGDSLATLGNVAFTPIKFFESDQEVSINAYTRDPSLIHGQWEWDGSTAATLYKVIV